MLGPSTFWLSCRLGGIAWQYTKIDLTSIGADAQDIAIVEVAIRGKPPPKKNFTLNRAPVE